MNDNELRQALAVMESYKQRVEALSEQVQVLRVSLEEVTMTSNAIKAFKDAKEGDEIMVKFMEIDSKGRYNLSRKDALLEMQGNN